MITENWESEMIYVEKVKRITEMFNKEYAVWLEKFNGNITPFQNFGDLLIHEQIAVKNCGKHQDCIECGNNSLSLPVQQIIEALGPSESYCED